MALPCTSGRQQIPCVHLSHQVAISHYGSIDFDKVKVFGFLPLDEAEASGIYHRIRVGWADGGVGGERRTGGRKRFWSLLNNSKNVRNTIFAHQI